MKTVLRHLPFVLFLVLPLRSSAQILFSNGSQMIITNGGLMITNGGTELANNSNLVNEGLLTVTKNSTFSASGNFILNTASSSGGDGIYRVEQDWINNAIFLGDNSTAELYGDTEQLIASTNGTVTTFNNLVLTGTGVGNNRRKTLQGANAGVGVNGTLSINDRELYTGAQTFFVLNTANNAVTNNTTPGTEGFVASLPGGYFTRATANTNSYLFPTGSSAGTLRYRPLEITPSGAAPTAYSARMNNNAGTVDGYDLSSTDDLICSLNDLYYHSIIRPNGNTNADITFFFLPAADGNWNSAARWRTPNARWNDLGAVNPGAAGGFSTLTRSAWNFPDNDHPYVLATPRPAAPQIVCPSLCENSSNVVFNASGSVTGYQWSFPPNATLISGQGTSATTVNWTTGSGWVTVFAPGINGGCDSRIDSCQPAVNPIPDVEFSVSGDGSGSTFLFTDNSSSATAWLWNFGDGSTSSIESPSYTYPSAGTYLVTLLVTGQGGCTNQATSSVVVIDREIFVPNSFTPNDNNLNEEFKPVVQNAEKYEFQVYNRWGEYIFGSVNPDKGWDGTYNGEMCQSGVYTYKLTVRLKGQREKVYYGHINLIR